MTTTLSAPQTFELPDRAIHSAAGRLAFGAASGDSVVLPDGAAVRLASSRELRDLLPPLLTSRFARVMVRRFLNKSPWTLHLASVPPGVLEVARDRRRWDGSDSCLAVPPEVRNTWAVQLADALDDAFPESHARDILQPIAETSGWYSYDGFASISTQTSSMRVLTPSQRLALVGAWDTGGPLTMRDLYACAGAVPVDYCGRRLDDDDDADAWIVPRYRVPNATVGHLALMSRIPVVVAGENDLPALRVAAGFVEVRDDVVFAEGWRLESECGDFTVPLDVFIPRAPHRISTEVMSRASEICCAHGKDTPVWLAFGWPEPWPLDDLAAVWPAVRPETFTDRHLLAVLPVRCADASAYLRRAPEVGDALCILRPSLVDTMPAWDGEAPAQRRESLRRQVEKQLAAAWECAVDAPRIRPFVEALEVLSPQAASAEALLDPLVRFGYHHVQEIFARPSGVLSHGFGGRVYPAPARVHPTRQDEVAPARVDPTRPNEVAP